MKHVLHITNQIILLTSIGFLLGCQPASADKAEQAMPPAPKVTVAKVISERITEWDEFTGRIEAVQTVNLRPRVSGYIDEVVFNEGSIVKAGDVLFHIDDKQLKTQVSRFEADVVEAQSQAVLAQNELVRGKSLKKKNAISQEELENRQAKQQQTKAMVHARKASLAELLLELDYTKVKAPISGRVSNAFITKGNYVNAGSTLLTTLVSIDKMYAYFDTDEQTYLKYTKALKQQGISHTSQIKVPVYMGLADGQDFPYEGYLDFIDNKVDEQTGTIRGRAVFDNANKLLTPGLFARLKVAGGASFDGVLIDDKAVGTDLNNKFVWVLNEQNQVQYRAVTLGKKVHGLRMIKEGLSAGDTIVISGLQRVRAGAVVDPQTTEMADETLLTKLKHQQQRIDELMFNHKTAAKTTHSQHKG